MSRFLSFLKYNKSAIIVAILCIGFTCWWALKLDSGPMIYRHTTPQKLEAAYQDTFLPYFNGRDIVSLRFGRKNAHASERVPVEISSKFGDEEWLASNGMTGPVLINIDPEGETLSLYWEIPEDKTFDDSLSLLADVTWDILQQYDDIESVKSTYTD